MCGRLLSSSVAFFVCLPVWMKSFRTFGTFLLKILAPSQRQKTKGKITCTATRNKPTCSKPEICKSKASFPADLLSPCHTPVSKNIRQHHVEHHQQTPSISIQHLPQAETEGAQNTAINEDSHAATRSTPWDSQLRGLPLAIACRMSSTRKQGRK